MRIHLCRSPAYGPTARPEAEPKLPSLAAAAASEAVVEVSARVAADLRIAAFARAARVEATEESAHGCVHPLVEIADHVVDCVAAPRALAALGRTSLAQERPVRALHQIEPRVEVTRRTVMMQDLCGVSLAVDVAAAFFIVVAVGVFVAAFATAGELPLVERAQALARVATGDFGEVPAQVAAGRRARE